MFCKLLFSPKPSFLVMLSQRKNQRGSFKSGRLQCIFNREAPLLLPDLLLPWYQKQPHKSKHEWMQARSCAVQTLTLPANVIVRTAKKYTMNCSPESLICGCWMWSLTHGALISHCTNIYSDRFGRGIIYSAEDTCLQLCEKLESCSACSDLLNSNMGYPCPAHPQLPIGAHAGGRCVNLNKPDLRQSRFTKQAQWHDYSLKNRTTKANSPDIFFKSNIS
jgi:hypothetical protein